MKTRGEASQAGEIKSKQAHGPQLSICTSEHKVFTPDKENRGDRQTQAHIHTHICTCTHTAVARPTKGLSPHFASVGRQLGGKTPLRPAPSPGMPHTASQPTFLSCGFPTPSWVEGKRERAAPLEWGCASASRRGEGLWGITRCLHALCSRYSQRALKKPPQDLQVKSPVK